MSTFTDDEYKKMLGQRLPLPEHPDLKDAELTELQYHPP